MAAVIMKSPQVSINGVDLSDYVRSVTLELSAELQDETASGDATRSMLAGLKNWTATVEFNQDYGAATVDATLFPLIGAAAFAIKIKLADAAISATNPEYRANAVLASYPPLTGTVGDLIKASITLQPGSDLTRHVA